MSKTKIKIIVFNLLVILLFLADRYFKDYFLNHPSKSWDFILFKFELWQNPGLAFGWGQASSLLSLALSPLTIIILIIFSFDLIRTYRKKAYTEAVLVTMVIWGAISNLLDRLSYGQVTDYLNPLIWPVFNLADVMVTLGIIGIIAEAIYRAYRPKPQPRPEN